MVPEPVHAVRLQRKIRGKPLLTHLHTSRSPAAVAQVIMCFPITDETEATSKEGV
jgi:hypothetical protein